MNVSNLTIPTDNIGCYFSSEQIDFLSLSNVQIMKN